MNGLGFQKISGKASAGIGIGASVLSFLATVIAFLEFKNSGSPLLLDAYPWIIGEGWEVSFSLLADELTFIMLFIITGIGSLIHLYSKGYMSHDEGIGKFFAYLNLFLFSMLLLVLGANYLILFIGWEGVGLCSYLLIGFWNKNEAFNNAARKAFIMNRVGDLGLLAGIFLVFQQFGSIEYAEVFNQAALLPVGTAGITLICLCFFIGATGKSAQIPLFTWLPDAMAGPTPVSALIHAATMVTAGLYLIVRSNVLFTLSPDALEVIAWIGALTAVFAASIGVFQNDIKKVLAYSTVSQLGYMFLGMGVMAYSSGFFHVITHAFFKALLFLGAGSVIHAMNQEQDIRKMGGLASKIKITSFTFLLGTIAISGIPPFAGFFSKDEILAHVFAHNKVLWALALFGSFLTAFYMFRLFFVTFTGSFRGTKKQKEHLHESPASMTIPLMVLAGLSVVGGLIGLPEVLHAPHMLNDFLAPVFAGSKTVTPEFGKLQIDHSTEWTLIGISTLVALLATLLAYLLFVKKQQVPVEDNEMQGWKKIIYHKYYVDELYTKVFVQPISSASNWLFTVVENRVLGPITWSSSKMAKYLGGLVSQLQNGSTSMYVFMLCIALSAFLIINTGTDIIELFQNLISK